MREADAAWVGFTASSTTEVNGLVPIGLIGQGIGNLTGMSLAIRTSETLWRDARMGNLKRMGQTAILPRRTGDATGRVWPDSKETS